MCRSRMESPWSLSSPAGSLLKTGSTGEPQILKLESKMQKQKMQRTMKTGKKSRNIKAKQKQPGKACESAPNPSCRTSKIWTSSLLSPGFIRNDDLHSVTNEINEPFPEQSEWVHNGLAGFWIGHHGVLHGVSVQHQDQDVGHLGETSQSIDLAPEHQI